MAEPITAMAVVAGIAQGGKALMQSEAAGAKEDALNLQAQQQHLQYQQKKISNLDMLDKITQQQIAQSTTRGTTLDSPSFNAIQRESFNISSRMGKNLDIEESILDRNNAIEKANVKRTLYAQLFGDAFDLAKIGSGIYDSMPS